MIRHNLKFISAVFLISVLAYSGTLSNGFVFDDKFQVLENRWITDPANLKNIFLSGVWDFEGHGGSISYNSYRPLIHLAYMSLNHLFGLRPEAYHCLNIVLHALNAVLVFLISSMLLRGGPGSERQDRPHAPGISFFAATVFALHPVNTEAVSWVACVTELLYTLFFLLSFLAYASGRDKRGIPVLSPVLFFIAALAKEPALMLPLALLSYDWLSSRPDLRRPSELLKRYAPYAIAGGVYLLLRFYSLSGLAPGLSKHQYLTAFQTLLNIPPLFAGYMRFLILPSDLTVFHVFTPVFDIYDPRLAVSAVVIAVILLIFAKTAKADRPLFFCLILTVIPLVPVMHIHGLGRNPFAERYLYLPAAGFALALALLSGRFAGRTTARGVKASFTLLACGVIALYAYKTLTRVPDWRDDHSLWKSALAQNPENYYAMNELGGVFLDRKSYDEAIAISRRAVEINSSRPAPDARILGRSQFTLATAYRLKALKAGRSGTELLRQAVTHYGEALKVLKKKSDVKAVYNDLGGCYMLLGLWDDAVRSFEASLSYEPDDEVVLRNLRLARKMAGA